MGRFKFYVLMALLGYFLLSDMVRGFWFLLHFGTHYWCSCFGRGILQILDYLVGLLCSLLYFGIDIYCYSTQ